MCACVCARVYVRMYMRIYVTFPSLDHHIISNISGNDNQLRNGCNDVVYVK